MDGSRAELCESRAKLRIVQCAAHWAWMTDSEHDVRNPSVMGLEPGYICHRASDGCSHLMDGFDRFDLDPGDERIWIHDLFSPGQQGRGRAPMSDEEGLPARATRGAPCSPPLRHCEPRRAARKG